MTVYFISNRLHAFQYNDSRTTEQTTVGSGATLAYDAAFVSSAIRLAQSADQAWVELNLEATVTDLWLHFNYNISVSSLSGTPATVVEFINASGVPVARLRGTGASLLVRLEYWNGSSWVVSGVTLSLPQGLQTVDIRLLCGASGDFEWYLNNALQDALTSLNAAVTNCSKIRFYGITNFTNSLLSEVVVADFSTLGMRVTSNVPTGNGFYADGTGGFGDVDDIPLNTLTGKIMAAVGNKATFTKASRTFPGSFQIEAVAVNAQSRVGGGVVTEGRNLLRISSTDYFSGDIARSGAFNPQKSIWEVSPATSIRFSTSEFNSLEFGIEARS